MRTDCSTACRKFAAEERAAIKKKPSVPIALQAQAVSVPAVTGIAMTSAVSMSKADVNDDEKI